MVLSKELSYLIERSVMKNKSVLAALLTFYNNEK
jgi:hypothetical protein